VNAKIAAISVLLLIIHNGCAKKMSHEYILSPNACGWHIVVYNQVGFSHLPVQNGFTVFDFSKTNVLYTASDIPVGFHKSKCSAMGSDGMKIDINGNYDNYQSYTISKKRNEEPLLFEIMVFCGEDKCFAVSNLASILHYTNPDLADAIPAEMHTLKLCPLVNGKANE
jgi:hypothetical protein